MKPKFIEQHLGDNEKIQAGTFKVKQATKEKGTSTVFYEIEPIEEHPESQKDTQNWIYEIEPFEESPESPISELRTFLESGSYSLIDFQTL